MKKYHVFSGKHAHFVKGNSVHMNLLFKEKEKKKSVFLNSTNSGDCSQLWLRTTQQSLSIRQNATLLIKLIVSCLNMYFLLFNNILQSLAKTCLYYYFSSTLNDKVFNINYLLLPRRNKLSKHNTNTSRVVIIFITISIATEMTTYITQCK